MSLSARGVLLGVFCGLLAIVGLWTHIGLVVVAAAALGIWCTALVAERREVRQLPIQVEAILPDVVRLGVPTQLTTKIRNTAQRLVQVEWLQAYPAPLIGPAQRLEQATIEIADSHASTTSILPVELGSTRLPQPAFRIAGKYGLASWNRVEGESLGDISVMPDTLRNYTQDAAASQLGNRHRRAIGQGSELEELRDYRPGDSLRMIDWKSTAKNGSHVIRETSEEQHLEIMIAVDAGRSSNLLSGQLSLLGHYVNVAARLAEYATLQGDRVGLLVFAQQTLVRIPPGRGRASLARIRAALATVNSQSIEANPLGAAFDLLRLLRRRSLVVLLSDFEHADTTGQQARATQLLGGRHRVVLASVRNRDVDELAVSSDPHWLTPQIALAAQDAQSDRAAVARQLRNLGAVLVHASDTELDQQVLATYKRLRADRRI